MELLSSLSRNLRQAIAENGDREEPVTIGDVYQRLIPYRTVRDELGILEFAAYEHGLLRLLSGEGGYVAVRHPQALEEIQRELASTNPILGIYRDYSDAPVDLVDGDNPLAESGHPPTYGPSNLAVEAPPAHGQEPETRVDATPPPASVQSDERSTSSPASSTCRSCEQPLPQIESLLYCPFCGESQGPQPCAACGTPIEGAWNFCIRCGAARGS